MSDSRIAMFLDFENLVGPRAERGVDLRAALDRLLERGRVVYRRAYADWARFREGRGLLHELGVELVEVPPSTRAGKNAADMRLVIDALELCYAREHIDTFAIASGDSDFAPLVYKLRENDRTVIGLGVREATSPFLVKACDAFLYLGRPGEAAGSPAPRRRRVRSNDSKQEPKEGAIPDIVREVVSSLLSGATGPLNPSLIKETIVRKQPDFDERAFGSSSFVKLLQRLEQAGLLRLQQHGRQWQVLPPDAPHAPLVADDGA